jgi:GT2 family glycosyltransferase
MPKTKVSIVSATYLRFDCIRGLVESIRVAFPIGCYETIIVASDPEDSEKMKWLRAQKDVTVYSVDPRQPGQPRRHSLYFYENTGIKAATGDWIFVLNDDMTISPDFYTVLTSIEKDWDVILVKSHVGERGLGLRIPVIGHLIPPDGKQRPLYLYDYTAIRREVYPLIGYLDEGLDWFGKGFDLAWLRILPYSELSAPHLLSGENRVPPHCGKDFQYATNKWNAWGNINHWSIVWPW